MVHEMGAGCRIVSSPHVCQARARSRQANQRPSGLALFRYAFHTEISGWGSHVALGLDTTFFTDRRNDLISSRSYQPIL
jgi:hypothetical protein